MELTRELDAMRAAREPVKEKPPSKFKVALSYDWSVFAGKCQSVCLASGLTESQARELVAKLAEVLNNG